MADQNLNRAAATGRLAQLSRDGTLTPAGLQIQIDLRTQFGFSLPLGTDAARYHNLTYHRLALGQ